MLQSYNTLRVFDIFSFQILEQSYITAYEYDNPL